MNFLKFNGFIRNISYMPQFLDEKPLILYDFENFDSNDCAGYGLIRMNEHDILAYTKWVSPKRTRSYPFSRIYSVYQTNSKVITIIPIIKDEGLDSMNNDRINAITFSWMNLLNIYIILAYYETADKLPLSKRKKAANIKKNQLLKEKTEFITNQKFNNDYIKRKIKEISRNKMSALHWNTKHFQDDFEGIWNKALECYRQISIDQNVKLHSIAEHEARLEQFKQEGKFDINTFKEFMNKKSKGAQHREVMTLHELEITTDGNKAIFNISNFLGGIYYLTADEIIIEDSQVIIQESKNTSRALFPGDNDIKDGLFKLILFSNMEKLTLNNQEIPFKTRLKLTGNLKGELVLPASEKDILAFSSRNQFKDLITRKILRLNKEAEINKISIHIAGNKDKSNKKKQERPHPPKTLETFLDD